MMEVQKVLDVKHGFDMEPGSSARVGYITSLKIGDQDFSADTTLDHPIDGPKKLKAVAVLSQFFWEGQPTDKIQFEGRISFLNRAKLASTIYSADKKKLAKKDVEVGFTVFEYDFAEGKYYECVGSGKKAAVGLLSITSGKYDIKVDDSPSTEVQDPQNFMFKVGVNPKALEHSVNMASSNKLKWQMPWGREVK
jgi:hypothetical protein